MDEETYSCAACPEGHTAAEWHALGMLCGRCGKHTGNNHQGHHWTFCKVYAKQGKSIDESMREPHFCCPDDCELEEGNEQSGDPQEIAK